MFLKAEKPVLVGCEAVRIYDHFKPFSVHSRRCTVQGRVRFMISASVDRMQSCACQVCISTISQVLSPPGFHESVGVKDFGQMQGYTQLRDGYDQI